MEYNKFDDKNKCKKEVENKMGLVIPDDIIRATGMSDADLKQEIAIFLFQMEKLTLEQASRLAGLQRLQFQHLLASRKIAPHYDMDEFKADLQTLKELERQ